VPARVFRLDIGCRGEHDREHRVLGHSYRVGQPLGVTLREHRQRTRRRAADHAGCDGVTYLHNPALSAKWIQVDDALAAVTIATLSGADPLVIGKSLAKAKVTSVKSGGGAGSSAYQVSIPIADYFAAAGKSKPAIPRLAKAATVVITLDADGKPLTIENNLGFTSISTTYADWGKEVAIVAPAKDEIGPLPTASPSS